MTVELALPPKAIADPPLITPAEQASLEASNLVEPLSVTFVLEALVLALIAGKMIGMLTSSEELNPKLIAELPVIKPNTLPA